jgi:predicted DNA-binding protein
MGKRFVVEVSDELHRRVRVLAAEEGITIADLVRAAIEREMEERRNSRPAPKSRKASAG